MIAGVGLLLSFAAGLTIAGRPAAWPVGVVLLAAGLGAAAVAVRRSGRRSARVQAELAGTLGRHEVLGELGTTLLTAGSPARMHHAVVDAAGDLVRDCPGGWASVLSVGPADDFVVTGGAGAERLPASSVPHDLLARLAGGATVTAASPDALGLTGLDPSVVGRPVVLLPLVRGEHFFGVLAAGADGALPVGVAAALDAVRAQGSLALEGEALGAELAHRATRDALTGLGNRGLLRDRLTGALARARRSGRPVGVMLLDLQGFRQVNEVHGHDAGDELLRVVADRLRVGVRAEDTIGRLGGDQFAVIAEDLRTAQDIVIIAERMVVELGRSVPVAGRVLRAPASVGIALSHPDTESPDQLLREAEAAMSAAKRRGGGRYQLHGATPTA
jgi:diguanylate cyclase (GGDEF)-like protein